MPYTPEQWRRRLSDAGSGRPSDARLQGYLEDSYPGPGRAQVLGRYARLTDAFVLRFGHSELSVARAPGRINLIGEHTDYALLPVLPVAVQYGVTVAARRGAPGRVRARSSAFPYL